MELGGVDEARDHFSGIILIARIGVNDAIDLLGGITRWFDGRPGQPQRPLWKMGDDLPSDSECLGIVLGQMVGHTGEAGVGTGGPPSPPRLPRSPPPPFQRRGAPK